MKFQLFLPLLIASVACAAPYYGYSERDWNNLTEPQQVDAKQKYKQIIDEKNALRHDESIGEWNRQAIGLGIRKGR